MSYYLKGYWFCVIYQVPKHVAVLNKALSFIVGVCRVSIRQQRFLLSSGKDKTGRNEW